MTRKQTEICRYLEFIESKNNLDELDLKIRLLLRQKNKQLENIYDIIDPIKMLGTQIIHGDYSLPNLLFSGESIAGVVDFRPPEPFLISYELGRIAFSTEALQFDNWMSKATIIINAYLQVNDVPRKEIVYCARAWLVQLVRSTAGIKQHYRSPSEMQSEWDDFALRRGSAAEVLMSNLPAIEDALAKL